jgi:DNA repair ATPase RecN
MQGAMEELMNMDSEQLKAQMQEAMQMLTSDDIQQNILAQKEEVLAMMEAQGTASPEEIAEYRADPKKFEQAMSEAFGQMKEIFNDPKNVETVTQMMQGVGAIMKDPAAAMSKLGEVLKDSLSNDDKIEEARLQLLSDPEIAGNKAINDMFGTEEMKEILNDPVKWRKSVKEGQKMMFGGDGKAGGIGMGEL